ncbi:hypothetical protein BV25DRAFT_1828718 [Artomyces pyxidatus]|uniref:Uncharacterized protein n=1 Tax=Artomyces pyxidatus TaxID=48021 RepID=A0ACB8SU43_9AGAM|nr:hypothetical protein BV25DRAFT_1828718 [Artomyces pyxidatus]
MERHEEEELSLPRPEHDLEVSKAHLFHVERLDLSGDHAQLTFILQTLNEPASILDRLHLSYSRLPWLSKLTLTQFFANYYPRLRTLSLTNCRFDRPVKFPTACLVNLDIYFDGQASYYSSPTLQVLDILEISTSSDRISEPWTSHRVVKPPCLSHLHAYCGKYVFLAIIGHLEIPPGVLLDLTVNRDLYLPIPDMHVALPLVSKHMHTVAPIQTLSLKYKDCDDDEWWMEALAWGIYCEEAAQTTPPFSDWREIGSPPPLIPPSTSLRRCATPCPSRLCARSPSRPRAGPPRRGPTYSPGAARWHTSTPLKRRPRSFSAR